MDHPAAGLAAADRGAQCAVFAQPRADREPARTFAVCHFAQRGAAQAPPGSEQRQRLEHVGLASAVVTNQQIEPRGALDRGRGVVAKIFEENAVEHGSPR